MNVSTQFCAVLQSCVASSLWHVIPGESQPHALGNFALGVRGCLL